MAGFHIPPDGPAPCDATVKVCKYGGGGQVPHFETLGAAEEAYAAQQGGTVPGRQTRGEKVSAQERDFRARDARQGTGTVVAQLAAEGISRGEIDDLLTMNVSTRKASLGVLPVREGEDEVLGVAYSGDYRFEEEDGLAKIGEALQKGTMPPGGVQFRETAGGMGILTIDNPGAHFFQENDRAEVEATALSRHGSETPYTQEQQRLDNESWAMSVGELRAALKGKVTPLPSRKDDLRAAYVEYHEPSKGYRFPTGEFNRGKMLTIVSESPAMKATMARMVEAHRAGALRTGASSNPFSGAVLFYDDRDMSRAAKGEQLDTIAAQERASDYVADEVAALGESGVLYAIMSDADFETTDVSTGRYFINYYPRDRRDSTRGIYGWFSKEELGAISRGDFSPMDKQDEERGRTRK